MRTRRQGELTPGTEKVLVGTRLMGKEFTVQSGMFIAGGRSHGGDRVRHFPCQCTAEDWIRNDTDIWNSAYSVSADSVLRCTQGSTGIGTQHMCCYVVFMSVLLCFINVLMLSSRHFMRPFCWLMSFPRSVLRPFWWWGCTLNNKWIDWRVFLVASVLTKHQHITPTALKCTLCHRNVVTMVDSKYFKHKHLHLNPTAHWTHSNQCIHVRYSQLYSWNTLHVGLWESAKKCWIIHTDAVIVYVFCFCWIWLSCIFL